MDLKAEIATLKDENDRKVNILVKVHLKELEDLRKENYVLKQEIAKRFESEEHEEIVIDKPQLSHQTDDQTNKDSKALDLNLHKNKLYTCSMCEKDFNSEKGLKGHMIFKHTNSPLTCA